MHILELPDELLIAILAQLDTPTLVSLDRVCKDWHTLLKSEQLWLQRCWIEGALPQSAPIDRLSKPARSRANVDLAALSDGHSTTQHGLEGLKTKLPVSTRQVAIAHARLSHVKTGCYTRPGASKNGTIIDPARDVRGRAKFYVNPKDRFLWRHQLDPVEGVCITTRAPIEGPGGLRVLDLTDGRVLFEDKTVKAFAHLEFSEGWLVHDTGQSSIFQVWKFERLCGIEAPRRGHLVKSRQIRCSMQARAFRLRWPLLLVGSPTGWVIHDVRTGQATEQYLRPRVLPACSPLYVEFDDRFVFFITWQPSRSETILTIFDRQDVNKRWDFEYKEFLGRSGLWADKVHQHYCLSPTLLHSQIKESDQRPCVGRLRHWPLQAKAPNPIETSPVKERWHAVHYDSVTGSLCLLSFHGLTVIHDYKAFLLNSHDDVAKAHAGEISARSASDPTAAEATSKEDARKRSHVTRLWFSTHTPYLAVGGGLAAFFVHNEPESIERRRSQGLPAYEALYGYDPMDDPGSDLDDDLEQSFANAGNLPRLHWINIADLIHRSKAGLPLTSYRLGRKSFPGLEKKFVGTNSLQLDAGRLSFVAEVTTCSAGTYGYGGDVDEYGSETDDDDDDHDDDNIRAGGSGGGDKNNGNTYHDVNASRDAKRKRASEHDTDQDTSSSSKSRESDPSAEHATGIAPSGQSNVRTPSDDDDSGGPSSGRARIGEAQSHLAQASEAAAEAAVQLEANAATPPMGRDPFDSDEDEDEAWSGDEGDEEYSTGLVVIDFAEIAAKVRQPPLKGRRQET